MKRKVFIHPDEESAKKHLRQLYQQYNYLLDAGWTPWEAGAILGNWYTEIKTEFKNENH